MSVLEFPPERVREGRGKVRAASNAVPKMVAAEEALSTIAQWCVDLSRRISTEAKHTSALEERIRVLEERERKRG
jgi:hypothetical protein